MGQYDPLGVVGSTVAEFQEPPMMPIVAMLWQWRRAILWGAIVAAVALMGWRVSAWREAYKAYPALEERLAAEVECKAGSACDARQAALQAEQAAKSAEVVAGYEQELAELRNRPIPVRTVRLCTARGGVQSAGPAGAADAGAPAAGIVPGAAGPDIGAGLYGLAREADEIVARCRALQDWNRALSAD